MRFRNVSGIFAAAFLIAASSQPCFADTIKIGVFGPFSGDAAAMGGSEKDSVSLVIQEKNAAGGIHGQQIEPVYADDSGKAEEAVNTIKRLISRDEVLINIGSISSPASLAASQVSRQSETPQIVVGGTAQRITTQGNKWVFRSPVPDTKLVSDLVDFIHEKFPKVTKFAFLYVNDDFGRGGFEAFKAAGAKYGFEIVAEERYTRGDIDFTAQLGRIKASPGAGHGRMVALHRRGAGRQAICPERTDPDAVRFGRNRDTEVPRARRGRRRRHLLYGAFQRRNVGRHSRRQGVCCQIPEGLWTGARFLRG